MGDEYFQDVVFVNLADTKVRNQDLRVVAKLRRTKELLLSTTEISDEGLASIHGMAELVPWQSSDAQLFSTRRKSPQAVTRAFSWAGG